MSSIGVGFDGIVVLGGGARRWKARPELVTLRKHGSTENSYQYIQLEARRTWEAVFFPEKMAEKRLPGRVGEEE